MSHYLPTKLRKAGSQTTGTYADPASTAKAVRPQRESDTWTELTSDCRIKERLDKEENLEKKGRLDQANRPC